MTEKNLWQSFLDIIVNEVNSASYHAWFHDLKLISMTKDKITIQVPMEIHKKVLSDIYYTLMDDTFYKLTNVNYSFEFLLKDEVDKPDKNVDNSDVIEATNVVDKPKESEKNKNEVWNSNLNPDLNFDNYIVGDSNRLAKVAGLAVAEQPGKVHNPLFIYGKSGIGKTHLMHAIGNYIVNNTHKKVLYTTSEMFKDDYVNISNTKYGNNNFEAAGDFKKKYRDIDVLIIDDIQYLVGAEKTQQEFFHTFNALHQANKQIIISSDRSPNDLKLLEERLRSRFTWGLPVDIYPPDFELRCKILKLKLKNMTISTKIDENVIEYIANSCQNDVRFLEGALNRLMAYTAMIVPEKIDLNFAVEALADFVNINIYNKNSIEEIQKAVADYYKITVDDLKGKRKSANIAYPRMIGMYLSRSMSEENYNRIGLEFGGRDHSTVIHACDKIKRDLKNNESLEKQLEEIKNSM